MFSSQGHMSPPPLVEGQGLMAPPKGQFQKELEKLRKKKQADPVEPEIQV